MANAFNEARVEIQVMHGSKADTSTEAGKQLLYDIEFGQETPGISTDDSSDRLYMREQLQLEEAKAKEQKQENDQALEMYRKQAIQAQSVGESTPPVQLAKPEVKSSKTSTRIRVKKATRNKKKAMVKPERPEVKVSTATAWNGLLAGYKSSSDEEEAK